MATGTGKPHGARVLPALTTPTPVVAAAEVPAEVPEAAAPRKFGHGGYRPGAGRPRGLKVVPHAPRPTFTARHPQHVSLPFKTILPPVRRPPVIVSVRDAIAAAHRDDFRIVHFAVLATHLHLIIETRDELVLAHRMQGFGIRVARALNRALGRSGKVFAERYRARALRTPREVREALTTVLLGAHTAALAPRSPSTWIDPCSSGPWFADWKDAPSRPPPWLVALRRRPDPTLPARTSLLATGWRSLGPLPIVGPPLDER